MSKIHAEEEARARVAALRHNYGGTYTGVSRIFPGFNPVSLSNWHHGRNVPREENMEMLRAVTS